MLRHHPGTRGSRDNGWTAPVRASTLENETRGEDMHAPNKTVTNRNVPITASGPGHCIPTRRVFGVDPKCCTP
eukprot:3316019-Pyramimonas_sp.AAC.1